MKLMNNYAVYDEKNILKANNKQKKTQNIATVTTKLKEIITNLR